MNSIDIYPIAVGRLTAAEAADFSSPFMHNWEYMRAEYGIVGAEGIPLAPSALEQEAFGLPDDYQQFFPALKLAVLHERTTRSSLVLNRAVLTVRQWFARKGESQQDLDGVNRAHRDGEGEALERFYTIADMASTQYFPDIVADDSTRLVMLTPNQPYVAFDPYEVIHASSETFHRAPPMPKDGKRTFMRLIFQYETPEAAPNN